MEEPPTLTTLRNVDSTEILQLPSKDPGPMMDPVNVNLLCHLTKYSNYKLILLLSRCIQPLKVQT